MTCSITTAQAQLSTAGASSSLGSTYFGTLNRTSDHSVRAPIPGPHPRSTALHVPVNEPHMVPINVPKKVDPIDQMVLVISADGTEADLPAIKDILDHLGTPYTVYIASQHQGDGITTGLTLSQLCDASGSPPSCGVHAYYSGVILTTGDLVYDTSRTGAGPWYSALSQQEFQNLWTFEATFGIREITWYTNPNASIQSASWPYPPIDYGWDTTQPIGTVSDSGSTSATYTATGQRLWGSYVNTAHPLTIQYAFTYLAKPKTDGTAQVVLQDGSGDALGVIKTYTSQNNRQNLALSFDSNASLIHDLVLSYGLINWVTDGLFLGERHIYMNPQSDDLFIDNDLCVVGRPSTCPGSGDASNGSSATLRISGTDLHQFLLWQQSKQTPGSTTQTFRVTQAFNGYGTEPKAYPADKGSLVNEALHDQASFFWLNHTYDHQNLDSTSYQDSYDQIDRNNHVATDPNVAKYYLGESGAPPTYLGLTDSAIYSTTSMVNPDISGFTNPNYLQAFYKLGGRYTVGNTSITNPPAPFSPSNDPYTNPSPNAGTYLSVSNSNGTVVTSSQSGQILIVPRHPTNLYYNVSTPSEWLYEDNLLYPSGAYGHVATYQQLLDRESSQILSYLLHGDIDPLMFHQPNLRDYCAPDVDPTAGKCVDGKPHSLLGDLLDAVFQKYNQYFTLPMLSFNEDGLGRRIADRMAYNASGVTASVVPGQSITIKAQRAATIPVTGLAASPSSTVSVKTYGGQTISYIQLAAGQSATFPLSGASSSSAASRVSSTAGSAGRDSSISAATTAPTAATAART
jgi:hypothetical protein